MTAFIRTQGLLPEAEIDRIIATAPLDLIAFRDAAAALPLDQRPPLAGWIDRFQTGVAALAA